MIWHFEAPDRRSAIAPLGTQTQTNSESEYNNNAENNSMYKMYRTNDEPGGSLWDKLPKTDYLRFE